MILIGEPLLACDATGRLKNRIATVFLKTPGIVTTGPMHIMQRQIWIDHLQTERARKGLPPLTPEEEIDEMELSVDLLLDNDEKTVQIRPDPKEMDMAFMADDLLQSIVSKRRIVYLNIENALVRNRLMQRGENWRMSQLASDQEQMIHQIASARVSIHFLPIYFYNKNTGTRFLTLDSFKSIGRLPDDEFRGQLLEIATFSQNPNHHGHPEIAVFPPDCAFSRKEFNAVKPKMSAVRLREVYSELVSKFSAALPPKLHTESVENLEWRNALYAAITRSRKSNAKCEVLSNISAEFYKQIEWLPGANITEDGELIFDKVFDEAHADPDDPDLRHLCDMRAKEFVQNYLRQFRNIQYINIGRIGRSLNRKRTTDKLQRSNVYIVHFKSADKDRTSLRIIRFQKYCIYEHLESGKEMLESIMEAVDYTDYIFNRRLACTQLGMRLPKKFVTGRIRETYHGRNTRYDGWRIWVVYFERDYVNGIASDKIPEESYNAPEFCIRLAVLLGEAAAVNMVVGRSDTAGKPMFDDGDEVILLDEESALPCDLTVSDHTGTLNDYTSPFYASAPAYAEFINNHVRKIQDPEPFIDTFLNAFRDKLEWLQGEYRLRKLAFDTLFSQLPYDEHGSLAYRWECILKRLASADAENLTEMIRANLNAIRRRL
jgi:hypothetical protein